jgi:hypothetical protein
MPYKPGLRDKSREIANARNWGIWLIGTVLGIGLFVSEYQRIRSLDPSPMNYAYLVLLVLTGLLIFLWIWATERELNLLFDWLDPERYVPPSTLKETILILFIAAVLLVMLFTARDPFLYGTVFTLYSAGSTLAGVYRDREITAAIQRSKSRLDRDLQNPSLAEIARIYGRGVRIIESYFIKRPMLKRGNICTVVAAVAWLAALDWKVRGIQWSGFGAYVLYIGLVIGSEAIIFRWRMVRDIAIRSADADLEEVRRKIPAQ